MGSKKPESPPSDYFTDSRVTSPPPPNKVDLSREEGTPDLFNLRTEQELLANGASWGSMIISQGVNQGSIVFIQGMRKAVEILNKCETVDDLRKTIQDLTKELELNES